MKHIHALTDKIGEADRSVEKIIANIKRCNDAASSCMTYESGLRSLEEKHTALLAEAFISGGRPNTSAIDAEIGHFKADVAQRREEASSAAAALQLLESQLATKKAERAELEEQRKMAIVTELSSRNHALEASYLATLNVLGQTVAEMVANDIAMRKLDAGNACRGIELYRAMQRQVLPVWPTPQQPSLPDGTWPIPRFLWVRPAGSDIADLAATSLETVISEIEAVM